MATLLSFAAAARALGMKSSGNLWYHKQRGRVVMVGDQVDLEATRAKIESERDQEQARKSKEAPSKADDAKQPPLWAAKEKTELWRAKNMELDYQERIGKLVDPTQMAEAYGRRVSNSKAHAMSIGARICAQCCAAKTPLEVKAIIDDEMRAFLRLLAGLGPIEQ